MKHLARDIDNSPPSLLTHHRQRLTSQKIRALHEEIDHRLVELPIVLLNRALRLVGSRVDDDDIDRTQLSLGGPKELLDLRFIRDIGLSQNAFDAGATELRQSRLGPRRVVRVR